MVSPRRPSIEIAQDLHKKANIALWTNVQLCCILEAGSGGSHGGAVEFSEKEPSRRQLKVESEVHAQVAKILPEVAKQASALKSVRLTVTSVRMSADLRNATVFVSILGTDTHQDSPALAQKDALAHVSELRPAIQKELARRIALKFLPTIRFRLDKSLLYQDEVDALLRKETQRSS